MFLPENRCFGSIFEQKKYTEVFENWTYGILQVDGNSSTREKRQNISKPEMSTCLFN